MNNCFQINRRRWARPPTGIEFLLAIMLAALAAFVLLARPAHADYLFFLPSFLITVVINLFPALILRAAGCFYPTTSGAFFYPIINRKPGGCYA